MQLQHEVLNYGRTDWQKDQQTNEQSGKENCVQNFQLLHPDTPELSNYSRLKVSNLITILFLDILMRIFLCCIWFHCSFLLDCYLSFDCEFVIWLPILAFWFDAVVWRGSWWGSRDQRPWIKRIRKNKKMTSVTVRRVYMTGTFFSQKFVDATWINTA